MSILDSQSILEAARAQAVNPSNFRRYAVMDISVYEAKIFLKQYEPNNIEKSRIASNLKYLIPYLLNEEFSKICPHILAAHLMIKRSPLYQISAPTFEEEILGAWGITNKLSVSSPRGGFLHELSQNDVTFKKILAVDAY